jgi:hypothetical protein
VTFGKKMKKRIAIAAGILLLGVVLFAYGVRNGMPYFAVLHVHMPDTGWRSVTVQQDATRFQGESTTLSRPEGRVLRRHMHYGPSSISVELDSGAEVQGYYFHCDVGVRRRADLSIKIDPESENVTCGFRINGRELYEHLPLTNSFCLSVLHERTAEPEN